MSDQPRTENVAQLPSRSAFRKLTECKSLGEAFQTKEFRDLIASAIPTHMQPDTMLRAFVQAANRAPLIYQCDMRQAIGAFMSLSYLGLVPGTVLQHAHMIPFAKTKWNKEKKAREPDGYDLQIIIGYQGYVELAFRSGFVRDLASGIVYPGDHFDFERGSKRFLSHKQSLETDHSRMIPRAAYAIAKFVGEGEEFEIMSWPEVLSIRNRAQAYRTALRAKEAAEEKGYRLPATWTESPWVRDEAEMGRKTAVRRLAKLLPKCAELQAGIGIEDANDAGRRIDFGPVIDGTATPMEGLPERPEDGEAEQQQQVGQRAADPGATHTDRRPAAQEEPPPHPGETMPEAGVKATPKPRAARAATSAPKPADKAPAATPAPAAPAFETVLIDQFGEPGEVYTDPHAFMRSIAALYEKATKEETEALVEHNADSIAEARSLGADIVFEWKGPAAESEQTQIESPADGEQDEDESGEASESAEDPPQPRVWEAVQPTLVNGKAAWSSWPNIVRDELASIDEIEILAFTEAQRPVIAEAPLSPRTLVVRAIIARFQTLGRTPPAYLAEALVAKAPTTQEQKDEAWLADRVRDLDAIPLTSDGRNAFDILVRSTTTQTVMKRLGTDNRALFERARTAFVAKNEQLPAAPGTPEA